MKRIAFLALSITVSLWAISAGAQTFAVLHSFGGADGKYTDSGLIFDTSGNLYGTTSNGGSHNLGTVFKISPGGRETVLHSFSGYPKDGFGPFAGVIRDGSGNLYGTTFEGGTGLCGLRFLPVGCGVVFRLSPTGVQKILFNFPAGAKGATPEGALIRDGSGNLYGTTVSGGSHGRGTVFRLSPLGTLTVLHSFAGTDGSSPASTLVRDTAGSVFGTAPNGGFFNNASCADAGCGVVFKLFMNGSLTVLHRFTGGTDGAHPYAGLIRDGSGNLYGVTITGGDTSCDSGSGCGTIYRLTATGYQILHKFHGSDGRNPYGALLRDGSGNLYGTTSSGGTHGAGTVFRLSTSGKLTVLHSFTGVDGLLPDGNLIRDGSGNLYGTTFRGGAHDFGTVFKVHP